MKYQIILTYLIVVNVVAFLAFGVDKWHTGNTDNNKKYSL